MRRTMSARIHDVAVSSAVHPIDREPEPKGREPMDPLVAAGRPPTLEEHDELRRMRIEARDELIAEPLDDPGPAIVVEVVVVQEAGRLDRVEPQEGMDASFR